jgi:hypothetical protein
MIEARKNPSMADMLKRTPEGLEARSPLRSKQRICSYAHALPPEGCLCRSARAPRRVPARRAASDTASRVPADAPRRADAALRGACRARALRSSRVRGVLRGVDAHGLGLLRLRLARGLHLR